MVGPTEQLLILLASTGMVFWTSGLYVSSQRRIHLPSCRSTVGSRIKICAADGNREEKSECFEICAERDPTMDPSLISFEEDHGMDGPDHQWDECLSAVLRLTNLTNGAIFVKQLLTV